MPMKGWFTMENKNKITDEELQHLFKFPKTLPNDVEDFTLYYPHKFPLIRKVYQEMVKKLYLNPVEFRRKCFELKKELLEGFQKIKREFDTCKNRDLKLLVKTDQKLHKLFCYRFWIVNYCWCDGPLHDFYVGKIKEYAEKIASWSEIEEKEKSVLEIERALLQSDYADLYLQSALDGLKLEELLSKIPSLAKKITELKKHYLAEEVEDSYRIIEEMLKIIRSDDSNPAKEIQEILKECEITAKVRGDNLGTYNQFIHALMFHQNTLQLKSRYDNMRKRLEEIFSLAKHKLSPEEYDDFKIMYQMSRNLIEAKDIFGEIDPFLIPFWFREVHGGMDKIIPHLDYSAGHAAVFRDIVWHLPDELKVEVMTPDKSEFSLE